MNTIDRRRLLQMLVMSGAVTVLPGCGGGEGGSPTTPAPSPTPSPTPTPAPTPREALLLISTGRSNGWFDVSYGQNHRVPDLWDDALDGPRRLTTTDSTGLLSFFGGGTAAAPNRLAAATGGVAGTLGTEETAFFAMAAHLAPAAPSGARFVCAASLAEGSRSMSFLSRPTADQIRTGTMETYNGAVAIPATSAEARLLAAGQGLSSLTDYPLESCATRWYKGIWTLVACKKLLDADGYRSRVLVNLFRHAEPEAITEIDQSSDPAYRAAVVGYLDTLNAALKEIFDQDAPLHCIDVPSWSNFGELSGQAGREAWLAAGRAAAWQPAGRYGANGAYTPAGAQSRFTPEARRKNDCATRAVELRRIANDRPDTILASTRSHKHNQIHEDAHDQRACGETVGIAARRVIYEKLDWKTFEPVAVTTVGDEITIEYQTPTGAALAFGIPQNTGMDADLKPALPYGYELAIWAGTWQDVALSRAHISLVAPNKVIIRAPVPIAAGFRIRYNFGARVPGLCDQAAATRLFDQRFGGRNDARNWPAAHELIGNR